MNRSFTNKNVEETQTIRTATNFKFNRELIEEEEEDDEYDSDN